MLKNQKHKNAKLPSSVSRNRCFKCVTRDLAETRDISRGDKNVVSYCSRKAVIDDIPEVSRVRRERRNELQGCRLKYRPENRSRRRDSVEEIRVDACKKHTHTHTLTRKNNRASSFLPWTSVALRRAGNAFSRKILGHYCRCCQCVRVPSRFYRDSRRSFSAVSSPNEIPRSRM